MFIHRNTNRPTDTQTDTYKGKHRDTQKQAHRKPQKYRALLQKGRQKIRTQTKTHTLMTRQTNRHTHEPILIFY